MKWPGKLIERKYHEKHHNNDQKGFIDMRDGTIALFWNGTQEKR